MPRISPAIQTNSAPEKSHAPFRGASLNELQCLRNRDRRWQGQKYENVIFDSANLDRHHFILPRNAAQERPKAFLQGRCNHGTPLFGTKNTMVVGADIGHMQDSAVPSGLMQS